MSAVPLLVLALTQSAAKAGVVSFARATAPTPDATGQAGAVRRGGRPRRVAARLAGSIRPVVIHMIWVGSRTVAG